MGLCLNRILSFKCHSERSPYREYDMDEVKNPVNRGRVYVSININGILHSAFVIAHRDYKGCVQNDIIIQNPPWHVSLEQMLTHTYSL